MRAGEIKRLLVFATGLRCPAVVGEEVYMADDLLVAHPLAGGVDHVDKSGISQ